MTSEDCRVIFHSIRDKVMSSGRDQDVDPILLLELVNLFKHDPLADGFLQYIVESALAEQPGVVVLCNMMGIIYHM